MAVALMLAHTLAEMLACRHIWVWLGSLLLLSGAWRAAMWLWWRPRQLERMLRAQGINGNPYRFLYGDLLEYAQLIKEARSRPISLASHRILPRVYPLEERAMNQHGRISFVWFGTRMRLNIMDPALIREVLFNKSGNFAKPKLGPIASAIVTGLVSLEGGKWAKHRKIINSGFHGEKLKHMLPAFSTCCDDLIERWKNLVGSEGCHELDVQPEFQCLTGDVISRAVFGGSYAEGVRICQLQSDQAELIVKARQTPCFQIPGYRFLPTENNIRRKNIRKEVQTLLRGIIEKRKKALQLGKISNDLLDQLLQSNSEISEEYGKSKTNGMTTEEVIEECKLFFFAGHETTSVLLTWTMVLLSMHPSWQVRAREEVLQVFGKNKPDIDGINRLKIVPSILYEVLRLYSPIIALSRTTYKTIELGGYTIPPEVILVIPILSIHHETEFWGEDAGEFNPERYTEGVAKAMKDQLTFFPFGWGPRICIGQSFAMLEAKMALSMILQHFTFELSPFYVHAPYTIITLQPQHGAHILLSRF